MTGVVSWTVRPHAAKMNYAGKTRQNRQHEVVFAFFSCLGVIRLLKKPPHIFSTDKTAADAPVPVFLLDSDCGIFHVNFDHTAGLMEPNNGNNVQTTFLDMVDQDQQCFRFRSAVEVLKHRSQSAGDLKL